MNNSHQQSSKENMESKCKNTRKHTLVAKEMEVCRNFQQNKSLKKMNSMRRGRIGKEEEISEVLSPFLSFYWLFIKRKEKSKVIFLTLGRNDQLIPLVLPTIHTSPKAF